MPEAFLLQPNMFEDKRGKFVKTYQQASYSNLGINFDVKEEFYSTSNKGVIRGMHFQAPPYEHAKIVYCLYGSVLDVLIDLRPGRNYGHVATTELSFENGRVLVIPKGVAHGFLALTNGALLLYKMNTPHEPKADCGIRWNSIGFDWGIGQPIVSERDQLHTSFQEFITPFK